MFLKPCSLNVSALCAAREVFIFNMNLNMKTTHGAIFMLQFYSVQDPGQPSVSDMGVSQYLLTLHD